jgi:predicted Mrr-cat superfamily restriction endonuclease
MNVWRLIPHFTEKSAGLAWCIKNNRIAIGWGRIGDLAAMAPTSDTQITEAIATAYAGENLRPGAMGGPSLWQFFQEVQEYDLVVVRADASRSVVMEVTGPYEWMESEPGLPGEFQHQRSAELTEYDPIRVMTRAKLSPGKQEPVSRVLTRVGEITVTSGLSR